MRARGSERASVVGWSYASSAVWVVPCLATPGDSGCLAAGGPTMALIRVVSSAWNGDLLARTYLPQADGSIKSLTAPIYTAATPSSDPVDWPQAALANGLPGQGWTASAPVAGWWAGESYVLATYADPTLSNAYSGYVWSTRSPTALANWGCSDDCGRLGFGYPTAVGLANDVIVPNLAALAGGVSSMALASTLLQQMYNSYTRSAPDVRSFFMGIGFPNGDVLVIWNCREAPDSPACGVAGPSADFVYYIRSLPVFGTQSRYWYKVQSDGSPATSSFFNSSAYSTTSMPWWTAGVTAKTGVWTQVFTAATPGLGLTGNRAYCLPVYSNGVLIAMTNIHRRYDKPYLNLNCFDGCKLNSYALRTPLVSGPALVTMGTAPGAATTISAASPIISALASTWRATRAGSILSGVGAGLYVMGGSGSAYYYGVYTCRAVPNAPACVAVGPAFELIGEVMSVDIFHDSVLRSFALNVDDSLPVRRTAARAWLRICL